MSSRREFLRQAGAASLVLSDPMKSGPASGGLELGQQFKAAADLLAFPGFVAGVVQNGGLTLVQAEGFADLERKVRMQRGSIFNVASLTKTFSAVTMMQYQRENRISLDDYVLDYPFLSVGFTSDRLLDANTRLKHVLRHTSEGTPGDNFVYNGSRYNFIYGAFERMSANTHHYQACSQELSRRTVQPLGLTSTLPGYPSKTDPRIERLITPYLFDVTHPKPVRDDSVPSGSSTLYPATNVFTTLDDLAKYTIALDEGVLLPAADYQLMTTPFTLNSGRPSPYGLGWSVQRIGDLTTHWHYGLGDSYSALIVRVPEKKTSLIVLVNSSAGTAPFLLGYGNLLTSPFALSFLRTLMSKEMNASRPAEAPPFLDVAESDSLFYDDIFSQVLLRQYMELAFGRYAGQAKALLRYLAKHDSGMFHQPDWAMITAISATGDAEFTLQMAALAGAYRDSARFHPDISLAIAEYYRKTGDDQKSLAWLRHVTDRTGYGEAASTRQACSRLGSTLIEQGHLEVGRSYLWKAAQYGRVTEPGGYQEEVVRKMPRRGGADPSP